MDENFTPVDNFTGDVVIEDETIKITDNLITEVVTTEEVEATEEKVEEVEMAEEEKVEEVEMATEEEVIEEVADAKVEMMTEEEILTMVQPKLDEIYEMIAELKANQSVTVEAQEEKEDVKFSKADIIMSQVDKIAKFKNQK
jgi:hypothetical protein